MTELPPRVPPPDLAPGDVYVYALGNGALFVLGSDGRSRLAPLDDAVAAAEGCHAAGCRVRVAWDDTALAAGAIARIRERGVPVDVVEGATPPHTWSDGTTALMEAAANGNDRLLDDLVARDATVHDRDRSGSTALHHAAANGNVHAIEALVGAGVPVDDRNDQGFTPYRLATATRQVAAAQRLADLGADTRAGSHDTVTFHRSHRGVLWAWPALAALALVAGAVVAVTVHPLVGVLGSLVLVVLLARLSPPRHLWAGGAPRELRGTTLTIQGLGAPRDVDLRQVTAAALGGGVGRPAFHGAGWILLDHPDGPSADRDVLRRLLVPPDELDALVPRFTRVLVVPLTGGRHDEVVVPLGNVLSGLGVDLSPAFRAQLGHARQAARDEPTVPWWRR